MHRRAFCETFSERNLISWTRSSITSGNLIQLSLQCSPFSVELMEFLMRGGVESKWSNDGFAECLCLFALHIREPKMWSISQGPLALSALCFIFCFALPTLIQLGMNKKLSFFRLFSGNLLEFRTWDDSWSVFLLEELIEKQKRRTTSSLHFFPCGILISREKIVLFPILIFHINL